MHRTITEYAGFVKNKRSGEYVQMFTTEIGVMLARGRAIEKATTVNEYTGRNDFDIDDCMVKQRKVTMKYGEWEAVKI